MNGGDLEPFCLTLNSLPRVVPVRRPAGRSTRPTCRTRSGGVDGPTKADTLSVNDPLRLPDANVYLLGHGYAPIVKYTDRYGHSVRPRSRRSCRRTRTSPVPARSPSRTSTSTRRRGSNVDPKTFVKQQVGFAGLLPTRRRRRTSADVSASVFPAEKNPLLVLVAYRGDLGLDGGIPQSVYSLDQSQIDSGALKAVDASDPLRLRPGQTAKLDDGSSVAVRRHAAVRDAVDALRPGREDRARSARSRSSSGCCSR